MIKTLPHKLLLLAVVLVLSSSAFAHGQALPRTKN